MLIENIYIYIYGLHLDPTNEMDVAPLDERRNFNVTALLDILAVRHSVCQ